MARDPDLAARDARAEGREPHRVVVRVDREPRDDRDTDPRAGEPLHDAVVVGAEHEVRLAARRAELARDDLGRAAVPVADQRLLGDLAQRRRTSVGGEGRGLRADEHVVVLQDEHRLEPRFLERQLDERDVENAALDEIGERRVGVRLLQLDLDVRPRLREPAHDLGQDPRPDALERADAERAGLAGRQSGEVGLRGLEPGDDCAAWRSSSSPASVSATGRGPPGRSISCSPTMRSRVAICWLTADWV